MSSGLKFERIPSHSEIQKHINPTFFQEIAEYTFYFLKIFIIVAALYIFVRTSLFDLIGVSGQSMFPNYNEYTTDDRIYIDQFTPKFSEYRRGDVVVLIAPEKCSKDKSLYIKRVIGLPDEKIAFQDGKVYLINNDYPAPGIVIDESDYLKADVKTYKNIVGGADRYEETKVGPDEYFVIGDNRTASADSRVCGLIDKNTILGREFYRVTPATKAKFYELPKYNVSNQND